MPPVANLSQADAVAALDREGLIADVRTRPDAVVPVGTAIETDPPAGDEAREGDAVILRVSGGPGETTVPDVANDSEETATATLRAEDFTVTTREEPSDTVEAGVAIGTDPAGGELAPRRSSVTLILSSGAEEVDVPNVTSFGRNEAEQTLIGRGFKVKVARRPTSEFEPGIVIEQDPSGGRAPRGSAVTITVAVAPANVVVESVISLPAAEARTILEDQGLTVTSEVAASDQPAETVIDQDPPAGEGVPPRTRVVITVSSGPPEATSPQIVPAPPPVEGEKKVKTGRGPDGTGPPGKKDD